MVDTIAHILYKQNNQNKKNNQNKQNKTENLKIQHIKSIGYNNIYEKLNKNLKKN